MKEAVRILLIDPSEAAYKYFINILTKIPHCKYLLEWVSDYNEGLEIICTGLHDIYLVDYFPGKNNGLELIRQAINYGCEAPMILIMEKEEKNILEKALEIGAADYFIKGKCSPELLLERSIRHSLAFFRNLSGFKRINKGTNDLVEAPIIHGHDPELNEMKSRFVSMASHEFRTPLSTILSSVSIIEQYAGKQGYANNIIKHTHRIKYTVDELLRILNDLLMVEKFATGKVKSKPDFFNFKRLAREIEKEMQHCAKPEQRIIFNLSDSNNYNVFLDKQLLKNILLNLISNSIKYSGERSTIHVTSKINSEEIYLTVKDNGIGIPEADHKHLFKRFFRASNALNIQGIGLGLFITKNFIDLMGGTIDFESKLNSGSKFTVKFNSATVN